MSVLLLVIAGFVSHGQKVYAQNIKVKIDTLRQTDVKARIQVAGELYAMDVNPNAIHVDVNPQKAGTSAIVVENVEIVCDCLNLSN